MRELDVRLVDHHQAGPGGLRGLVQPQHGVGGDGGPGRVVRRADEQHVRPVLGDRRDGGVQVDGEVVVARAGDPAGAGAPGDQRVHRVRGLEAERGATGAAEGLQQLLEHLVGAVGGPDVLPGDGEAGGPGQVAGQALAQLDRVPVGVAVEVAGGLGDPLGDPRDQLLGERVRVLVGVQLDRDVELGGAVGRLSAQLVPDGEVVDRGHVPGTVHSLCQLCSSPTKRALIASP